MWYLIVSIPDLCTLTYYEDHSLPKSYSNTFDFVARNILRYTVGNCLTALSTSHFVGWRAALDSMMVLLIYLSIDEMVGAYALAGVRPTGLICWISSAAVFSFIYRGSLILLYLLFIS